MRRGWLVALGVVLGAVAIYKTVYPTVAWHQKLTIELAVDGQVVSGSAVGAVKATKIPDLLERNMAWEYRGEATVVELPGGRYLFALVNNGTSIAEKVFIPELKPGIIARLRTITRQRGARDVPEIAYPLLVTFTDINDPTSVRKVDPDDLAASFGPGVALKRITLEITDDKVTKGSVEKVLGWLDGYYGSKFDGQRYETINAENRLANSLSASNFDTEN